MGDRQQFDAQGGALADATFIAIIKGLAAGTVNITLAWWLGATQPPPSILLAVGAIGFLSYGLSLVLFVVALRHLGTARTVAYFHSSIRGSWAEILIMDGKIDPSWEMVEQEKIELVDGKKRQRMAGYLRQSRCYR